MNCKIQFIPEAVKDYTSLDGGIKKLVNEKIERLKENPFVGEPLGNKDSIDLTGYYKIYLAKKTYRIVYRIISDNIEIVEIWGIGKRDKLRIELFGNFSFRKLSFKKCTFCRPASNK